jgi:manganese/zinc/iron transport system permease protein
MLELFKDFLFMREPNIRLVVAGSMLLCGMSALVGCFTFLRKRALVGDAISHSVLPGVCLAFMLTGEKNPVYFLIGALITGMLSLLIMDALTRFKYARPDTAIALMLSVFFGIGIVFLTSIQHSGNAAQAGLDKFLFGKAASITSDDIRLFSFSILPIVGSILILLRGFYLISFDEEYAQAIGFPVKRLRFALSLITVWAVAIGIQAVGVVLMAALLITPALAARLWTNSIKVMLILAVTFGLLSGYVGAFVSYSATAMPTGPWIVVVATFFAVFSMVFAPGRGILSRWKVHRTNNRRTLQENILKLFYQLGEKTGDPLKPVLEEDLINFRSFQQNQLNRGLNQLLKKGWIVSDQTAYKLTVLGNAEARRVVRLHRLWELYLQQYLHLAPDHVHDDAEAIEHVITPEIEAQLELILGKPEKDPHNTQIPSANEPE